MRPSLALALALASAPGCKQRHPDASAVKITNGRAESGFPYVVRVTMDGSGACTGSFVSDSLLLTAAHCVDRAQSVEFQGASAKRADFFIQPDWPRQGTNCKQEVKPEFDLALVRFPPKTYVGTELARLPHREPEEGDRLMIIGYGHSVIQQYDRYCSIPEAKRPDGKCHLLLGTRQQGVKFDYATAFTWDPVRKDADAACPAECDSRDFRAQFAALRQDETVDLFLQTRCGGTLDTRGYKESGAGPKRAGFNVVDKVKGGVIDFRGGLGGKEDGENAASGRGDSGGPLLLEGEEDVWYLAGATSGGSLLDGDDGAAVKRSKYVSIISDHNLAWLRQIVAAEKLDFPDLAPDPPN